MRSGTERVGSVNYYCAQIPNLCIAISLHKALLVAKKVAAARSMELSGSALCHCVRDILS